MDKIGPTPVVNPRMAKLAELLRKVKDKANEWSQQTQMPGFPVKEGAALGDVMVGDAPDEVKNWGYGDYPVRINPDAGRTASYVPEITPGRQKGVADALMAVPLGGGGGAAEKAGTLPFKLRNKTRTIDDWVGNGMYPYTDADPRTIKRMRQLAEKADKLSKPETLYRIAHDPEEVKRLRALKEGDMYSPGRLSSTTRNEYVLEDLDETFDDIFADKDRQHLTINAPAGVKIGGDLGSGNADFYNEFLVRPDASFEVLSNDRTNGLQMRALTESEANLRRRLTKLREKK